MNIQDKECYTLRQILKQGLLIAKNGKPYTSKDSIRRILLAEHIQPIATGLQYRVTGKQIKKINDRLGNSGNSSM